MRSLPRYPCFRGEGLSQGSLRVAFMMKVVESLLYEPRERSARQALPVKSAGRDVEK